MLSDVFCIRLLTSKNQFVHGLLIDVIVICSRVLRPIHEVRFRNELCQLPLMDIISLLQRCFTISAALVVLPYSSAPYASLTLVQGFSLMVTTHNSTALKENGMAEDIFYFLFLLEAKKFLYPIIRSKKAYVCVHSFSVSFFSSSDVHQSQYLDGCQEMGKSSSFIEAFWAFRFLYP